MGDSQRDGPRRRHAPRTDSEGITSSGEFHDEDDAQRHNRTYATRIARLQAEPPRIYASEAGRRQQLLPPKHGVFGDGNCASYTKMFTDDELG
jgi:hypothetical protein